MKATLDKEAKEIIDRIEKAFPDIDSLPLKNKVEMFRDRQAIKYEYPKLKAEYGALRAKQILSEKFHYSTDTIASILFRH